MAVSPDQDILDIAAAVSRLPEEPKTAESDDDIIDIVDRVNRETERRQSELREKYVWPLLGPLVGNRAKAAQAAAEEITEPDEREWLVSEVARIAQKANEVRTKRYNEKGYLGRLGEVGLDIGESLIEGFGGISQAGKKWTGLRPKDEDVPFINALEAAKQGEFPTAPREMGLAGKAATGAARMAPDVAAGTAALFAGGPGATFAYAGARQFPESREGYLEMGLSPGAATLAGAATSAAEAAIELINPDVTGLTKPVVQPAKGFLRRGITAAAEKVGGETLKTFARHPVSRRAVGAGLEALKSTGKETLEEGLQGAVETGGRYLAGQATGAEGAPEAGDILTEAVGQAKEALPGIAVLGGVGGMGRAAEAAGRYKRFAKGTQNARVEAEILQHAEVGKAPSRSQWAKWGLPSDGKLSAAERLEATKQWAEEFKVHNQVRSAISGATPTAEQWRQWDLPEEEGDTPEKRKAYLQRMVSEGAPETPAAPEPESPASPEAPAEGLAPSETPAEGPSTGPPVTSIKNEIVTELRQQRGESPVEGEEPEAVQTWLDRAEGKIKEDNALPDRLVSELNATPRSLSDEETAVLQIHYRRLHNTFTATSEKLFAAQESGDQVEIERAQAESNAILGQLQETEEAAKAAGREWGRAGVARQMTLQEDFSLGSLVRRSRVAKGGGPLSEEELSRIRDVAREVERAEYKLGRREVSDDVALDSVSETIETLKPKKSFKKTAEAYTRATAAWEEFKGKLGGGEPGGLLGGESGALDVDLVASGVKLVKAYLDLGVASFSEFMAVAAKHFGDEVLGARDALRASWGKAKEEGLTPSRRLDPDDAASISRAARTLTRSLVKAGVTERDAVVDAVHEELRQDLPEITRRQVMDAISGYGQYTELSKDQVSATIRDLRGQLQQLAKLEDMEAGQAPKKTGFERREPSDAERRLIQQVNEAKRRGGFDVTDPETQLKSALASAKTAVRNRIADMEEEIRTRQKIVKKRTALEPDAELEALRRRRDELRKVYDEVFPKEGQSEEQRIASAGRALDRAITQLEADLESGDIGPKSRPAPVSTPELEAKRARLDALRQQRDELRAAAKPKRDPEELRTAAYKRSLLKRLADLQERMAAGDFSKRETKPIALDEEATHLKYQLNEARQKFRAMEESFRRSQRSTFKKTVDLVPEALRASRQILTGFDLSAVFRQGSFLVFAHPLVAARAMPGMFRAFASEESEFAANEELLSRPNAGLYRQCGMKFTSTQEGMNAQEEGFIGRWAKHIPFVAGSERAYTTFLNRMRADVFDILVAKLCKGGKATIEEGKVLANFVNVASGRGNLGSMNAAAVPLATLLFSPKYMVSRFQLLAGQPMWKGTARTRWLITKEYARALGGILTFISLMLMLGGSDDEPVVMETDPRSTEFGKLRFGNTRIDPFGGLAQTTVFLTRLAKGQTKARTGEIVPIRGEGVPYAGLTTPEMIGRFLRGKLAPAIGSAVDVLSGENIVGEPVTPASAAVGMVMPLSFRDVYDAMQEQNVPKGAALAALAIFGMNAQNYENATAADYAVKIARHPRLTGRDQRTREPFDHTNEVSQVVSQAKRMGLTERDLLDSVGPRLRELGYRGEAINSWKLRLRNRFRQLGDKS